MRRLGYPELSVGDAHKARLLIEAALEASTELGRIALLTFAATSFLEVQCAGTKSTMKQFRAHINIKLRELEAHVWTVLRERLSGCIAFKDMNRLRYIIARKTSLPSYIEFAADSYEMRKAHAMSMPPEFATKTSGVDALPEQLRSGLVKICAYPWMTKDMLSRDDESMKNIKYQMRDCSSSQCKLTKSTIKNELEEQGNKQMYGVTAAKTLRKGDHILHVETTTAIPSVENSCSACRGLLPTNPIRLICCEEAFCCSACAEKALASFHKVLCGRRFDLPGIDELKPAGQGLTRLLLRFLAIMIQQDEVQERHPLLSPLVRFLAPSYGQLSFFDYNSSVVWPIHILQTLGVDVFADLRYDTWLTNKVIKVIKDRIMNNASGTDAHVDGQSTAYTRAAVIDMKAVRDIRKGEALFISYLGHSAGFKWRPDAERQRRLSHWAAIEYLTKHLGVCDDMEREMVNSQLQHEKFMARMYPGR
ncbi:hypothetical protein EJ08DRAFT_699614 [Tothia fuscella]|uniref:SET domain-containing protein n=1 Tax=Tothia fuscella TaxID=1048955 RepID=A0A9P4TWQ0_9PEZI|nr:hypothetical protein EJ08DRAFT_699614 [Tothia fuscella]